MIIIKIIETEGKSKQEIQNFLDECVSSGARPYRKILGVETPHDYITEVDHTEFNYAGVDIEGNATLCKFVGNFTEID